MSPHLDAAIRAARAAGNLLRAEFGSVLEVNAAEAHDVKLELDVRTQRLIEGLLLAEFPGHAILGEEGSSGTAGDWEWILDPIDGTVNFFYGIPHFCISIALRHAGVMQLGVILDPMRDELWAVERGGVPTLNGRPIRASTRDRLADCILTVGFAKTSDTIKGGLPLLEKMVHRARKCRMMGSAALDLAYVATGRLDAYIEQGVSLWDIAAGQLLVEAAGGKITVIESPSMPGKLAVTAWNGVVDLAI
jgi:myo-inositol-1(or 4)-monophosphatase